MGCRKVFKRLIRKNQWNSDQNFHRHRSPLIVRSGEEAYQVDFSQGRSFVSGKRKVYGNSGGSYNDRYQPNTYGAKASWTSSGNAESKILKAQWNADQLGHKHSIDLSQLNNQFNISGAKETRPINVTVNTFIKVN